MITVFICTDDTVAKEITKKYLNRDSLPYVNMLSDITYDQAVKAIEGLEKGSIESQLDEVYAEKTKEEEGWTPVAITEECLKPSDDELMIVVAYSRPKDADGTELQYVTEMRSFSIKEAKEFVKKWGLTPIKESEFNKKY